jgi:ATP-dependent DNA helicase RecG
LRQALDHLHEPPPGLDAAALEDRSHPAWQRLKFEELLAQQLSQLLAQTRAPAPARAAAGDARGGPCTRRSCARCRSP